MSKYITEKTLRTIQIRNARGEKQIERMAWIRLLCKIAIAYQQYFQMRQTADISAVDLSVDDAEFGKDVINAILDIDMTLSDTFDYLRESSDSSINFYENYQKILKSQEDTLFNPMIVDMLCKELYKEDCEKGIADILLLDYYGDVALLILDYMFEELDYDTFMKKLMSLCPFPIPMSIDGKILRKMIRTAEKWEKRYFEIFEEEIAKGNA